ncbi:terminase family protein [Mesorhizobium sp. M1409]|uniref:terminase large subunit domain-containing protein n=1 Tax=Mesorhizobium sp. M1409 TaxID=2957100 RepID=UPI003338F8DA
MNVAVTVQPGFVPQRGPQTAFINCPCDIVIFGGARGGGKTHGSLGDFWIHAEDYGEFARGLMVRKTREDLKDTIAAGVTMFGSAAQWKEKGGYFQFLNGAKLYCAYLETDRDAENYQGWSLTRVYVEELTQYGSGSPVFKLLACLRSAHGVPCQMKCTCNPGGPGHHWVKAWVIDLGPFNAVTDPENGLTRVFIPSRLADNPKLLENDPGYINKLKASGSAQLVRAWLEGDWNVIEGAFFPEFNTARHVIPPFVVPDWWTRFRSMDWGSAKPFSIGWWTVVQEDFRLGQHALPRGAIVRYREWYGAQPGRQNEGLKMPAEAVAKGIVTRETHAGARERIAYGVLDPAAFAVISGPSIGETMLRHGAPFRRADNTRVSRDKRMGGWDQVRARLVGDGDGRPMIFFFETCRDLIRTLPMMQHDQHRAEDVDTDGEDHAVDDLRYACLSRPYIQRMGREEDRNPYLIANAFKLHELR